MGLESVFSGIAGRCAVIAEVGMSHEGSLGLAHAYIDALADAGVDAVKFQTHFAEHESTVDEPWRVPFSTQDASRYDYWKRTAFTAEQWAEIAGHCNRAGVGFLSSPFSEFAVEMLRDLGSAYMKVASGEVFNPEVLNAISNTGLPVLVSRGLASIEEVAGTIEVLERGGCRTAVLQCTSEYPAPPERWGLGHLSALRERLQRPVGLSDHSGTQFPGIAAAALGAVAIEVHVAFDRRMFGPDAAASLEVREMSSFVRGVAAVAASVAQVGDDDTVTNDAVRLREVFGRSLALRCRQKAGTVLVRDMLVLKKPGTGIPPSQIDVVLGRRLATDVEPHRLLRHDDLQ